MKSILGKKVDYNDRIKKDTMKIEVLDKLKGAQHKCVLPKWMTPEKNMAYTLEEPKYCEFHKIKGYTIEEYRELERQVNHKA